MHVVVACRGSFEQMDRISIDFAIRSQQEQLATKTHSPHLFRACLSDCPVGPVPFCHQAASSLSMIAGKAPMALAIMWSLTAITLMFVVLRFYTRAIVLRQVGWDDYIFVLSGVSPCL